MSKPWVQTMFENYAATTDDPLDFETWVQQLEKEIDKELEGEN